MAGAWALISAKQCVSVSDCVVFVREMGGAVCGVIGRRLYFCGMVRVRWGCLPIRLCWVCDGGLAVSRPFFISGLFGCCVMTRGGGCNVINGRFV